MAWAGGSDSGWPGPRCLSFTSANRKQQLTPTPTPTPDGGGLDRTCRPLSWSFLHKQRRRAHTHTHPSLHSPHSTLTLQQKPATHSSGGGMSRLGCSAGCFCGCGGQVQTSSLTTSDSHSHPPAELRGGPGPASGHQCQVPIVSKRFCLVWGWFAPRNPTSSAALWP